MCVCERAHRTCIHCHSRSLAVVCVGQAPRSHAQRQGASSGVCAWPAVAMTRRQAVVVQCRHTNPHTAFTEGASLHIGCLTRFGKGLQEQNNITALSSYAHTHHQHTLVLSCLAC